MRLAVFLSTLAVLLPGGWALTVTSTTRSWRSLSPGGSTHLPRHVSQTATTKLVSSLWPVVLQVSTSGAKLALLVAGEEGLFMSGDSGESWYTNIPPPVVQLTRFDSCCSAGYPAMVGFQAAMRSRLRLIPLIQITG